MSSVQLFNFEDTEVRVLDQNGEPWFFASDVAKVLGYTNSRKAVSDHCEAAEILRSNDSLHLEINPRGVSIIPERDVYRLIMRSKLPAAKRFEEWVVGEVLPTIRKTGHYGPKPFKQSDDLIMGILQCMMHMRSDQLDLGKRLDALEAKMRETESKQSDEDKSNSVNGTEASLVKHPHDEPEWVTALGIAKEVGLNLDAEGLRRLGRHISYACKNNEIDPKKIHHAVYGQVNLYPREIAESVAQSWAAVEAKQQSFGFKETPSGVETAIMMVIKDVPESAYGQGILRAMSENFNVTLTNSDIYSRLKNLRSKGFIIPDIPGGGHVHAGKYYRLTDLGRDYLNQF